MKKSSVIKLITAVAPSILMLILIYLMRDGKDILDGLYFIFPIMYIFIGIVSSAFFKEFLIAIILTSIAFIIPINLFFNMGSCVDCALIYTALGCASYFIKKLIKKKSKDK